MTKQTYTLEFLTPCFCAGAEPALAEVRAPSIRGRLRWWFRVLGGSREDEGKVFGETAGDSGSASSLIVRVEEGVVAERWQPVQFNQGSNTGYLLYFAKASGDGARWVEGGAIPVGAKFELQLLWRRKLQPQLQALFDLALESFLILGSLGLRSTRGLGCFATEQRPFSRECFDDLRARIQQRAPTFQLKFGNFEGAGAEQDLLNALGRQLRGLRKICPAGAQSPLGASIPRQASAVYLRPVRTTDGAFKIVVFEAPAERVLRPPARRVAPILAAGVPEPHDSSPRGGRIRRF